MIWFSLFALLAIVMFTIFAVVSTISVLIVEAALLLARPFVTVLRAAPVIVFLVVGLWLIGGSP